MTSALPQPPPPLPADAIFLDFDGTLVDIAETPGGIRPDPQLPHLIDKVRTALSGRVAVLTGRAIETVDRFLSPQKLPIAGLHGLEHRAADGSITSRPVPAQALQSAREALRGFTEAHPGTELEDKRLGLALHFRRAPQAQTAARAAVDQAIRDAGPLLTVQPGKMVYEIKVSGVDKGKALETFMKSAPFCGARPVMLGDDLTDETAFAAAERQGGFGILVGALRDTRARYHLPNVPACHHWLHRLTSSDAAGSEP